MSKPSQLSTRASGLQLHPDSVVPELADGIEYAGALLRRDLPPDSVQDALRRARHRPVKVVARKHRLQVADPDVHIGLPPVSDGWVVILGEWDGPVGMHSSPIRTWRQYAAHAYGDVLKQRELADRLSALGITRQHETYLMHRNLFNAVERELRLNYDELEFLLDVAGH